MAWREATPFERELLEDVSQRWADFHSLALHLFLAPRVEPLLLRNARLHYAPQLPAEAESLLWFSPLVAARNTREIVFHLGVAKALADEFMQREQAEERLADLWQFTRRHTRHWNAEDRLERDLRYHALRGDDMALADKLRHILRRIHQESDEQRRIALARLVKRALPVIAPETAQRQETRWLAQYAGIALGDAGAWANPGEPSLPPSWLAGKLPAPLEPSRLGVEIRHDSTLGQVLHFIPARDDLPSLVFAHPLPARLHVAPEGRTGTWHSVAAGSRIAIRPASPHLRLATVDGRQWDLHAQGLTEPASQSAGTAAPTLWLAHVAPDVHLAEAIADWLRKQDIRVELIAEDFGPQALVEALGDEDNDTRVLRLWTRSARHFWAERAEPETARNGVLLRAEDVDLPAAGTPGGLLDWRDWQRLIDSPDAARLLEPLQRWLESGELPLPPEVPRPKVDSEEINTLLAELDNPETTPPRRLEIGDRLAELGDSRPGVGVIEIEVPAEDDPRTEVSQAEPTPRFSPEIESLLAEIDDPETTPPRRLEIGDRLAKQGDPRPGVGLDARGLPDIDWVKIPGGPFIYQEGETRELPTFWIARYPITNAQFQAFVDNGGYRNKRWWRGLKQPKQVKSDWPQPNRPRTNVSWYEAVAFSRWLCARLGLKEGSMRLPTEEKWEKAARGTDGRIYAWGFDYRSGYANVDEMNSSIGPWYLEQTTAVGLYPHGGSPGGAQDLAGTVWEWCLNKYEKPEETRADSSDDSRVIRGGSYSGHPDHARAVFRVGTRPDYRGANGGFRLVSSFPMVGDR